MTATLLRNRIAPHFDTPAPARPVPPQSELARGRLWSDLVFEALLTLRTQLTSRNEAVAAAAANSILELERTRMRHDKCVAGSRSDRAAPEEEQPEPIQHDDASPATDAAEERSDDPGAMAAHVEEVRRFFEKPRSQAVQFVEVKLHQWAVTAERIPRGAFIEMLRLMGDLPKEADPSGPPAYHVG